MEALEAQRDGITTEILALTVRRNDLDNLRYRLGRQLVYAERRDRQEREFPVIAADGFRMVVTRVTPKRIFTVNVGSDDSYQYDRETGKKITRGPSAWQIDAAAAIAAWEAHRASK